MDDHEIVAHIDRLADEEQALYLRSRSGTGLKEDDHARLRSLEVALDQCWDLLRQRRARRAAGLDPEEASSRDETVVEGYRQ